MSLRISENSQDNTCARVSFFHKVSGPSTFLQKETLAKVFSCEFFEIFKNTFFTEHLRWLLLKLVIAQYLRVIVTNIFRRNCWQMFLQLYWKGGPTQAFSCEYYEIFKLFFFFLTAFFLEYLRWTLLYFICFTYFAVISLAKRF